MSAKAHVSAIKWRRVQEALRAALGADTAVVAQIAAVLRLDDAHTTSHMSKTRWASIDAIVRAAAPDTDPAPVFDAMRDVLGFDEHATTYTPGQARAAKTWIQRKKQQTGLSAYVVTGEQRRRQEGAALRAAHKAQQATRVQSPPHFSLQGVEPTEDCPHGAAAGR